MKGLDYEKNIENIKTFIEERDLNEESSIENPSITFQVTFMESNLNEITEIFKLAINLKNLDK